VSAQEVNVPNSSRAAQVWVAAAAVLLGSACWNPPELPKIAPVPAFQLLDQNGHGFDRDQLRGVVWIANFMFTSCPDVCPLLTARMSGVRTQLAPERGRVRFVSFSVDPGHDSPEALKKYAAERGADWPDWSFATGAVDRVKEVVVSGFKQTMQPAPSVEGKARSILHGSHFVLVDDAFTIRGFYTTDAEGLMRLVRDAKILAKLAAARRLGGGAHVLE
jgi:protein SCO1/2